MQYKYRISYVFPTIQSTIFGPERIPLLPEIISHQPFFREPLGGFSSFFSRDTTGRCCSTVPNSLFPHQQSGGFQSLKPPKKQSEQLYHPGIKAHQFKAVQCSALSNPGGCSRPSRGTQVRSSAIRSWMCCYRTVLERSRGTLWSKHVLSCTLVGAACLQGPSRTHPDCDPERRFLCRSRMDGIVAMYMGVYCFLIFLVLLQLHAVCVCPFASLCTTRARSSTSPPLYLRRGRQRRDPLR